MQGEKQAGRVSTELKFDVLNRLREDSVNDEKIDTWSHTRTRPIPAEHRQEHSYALAHQQANQSAQ